MIYLSPDAPAVLWRVQPAFTYVIGGLIDRSAVVKDASLRRSYQCRVPAARLPLMECCGCADWRKLALNVDTVFALLLHVHQAAQRIRQLHSQPDNAAPAPSPSPSPPAAAAALRVNPLGVEVCHRASPRQRNSARKRGEAPYAPPTFPSVPQDEQVDWHALWCDAIRTVIPKRLRLRFRDAQEQQTAAGLVEKGSAR